jgi:ribosomal protein S18 acetylase RimI-like enzyme
LIHVFTGFGIVECFNFQYSKRSHRYPLFRSQTFHEHFLTANSRGGDVATTTSSNIHVLTDCDDATIQEVASFLIDAYWLSTPRLWTDTNVQCDIPIQASKLQKEASDYLRTQYGERLGKRQLRTCLVVAEARTETDNSEIAGLLCMHELIWDNDNILPDEESESILRNAVATIGPKDRRAYKDSTAIDIATNLLPPANKAVCVFSNLAVAPAFRRQGVGAKVCQAAEDVAREWGYEYLHLKVEAENTAAANLYQNKLGYRLEQNLPADPAIRLDLNAATFIDTAVETLILSKKVQ